jgi:hypothetical protein
MKTEQGISSELKRSLEFTKVARLIPTGMRNIDRMREDIHCTINAVLGLIGDIDPAMDTAWSYADDANGYRWNICIGKGRIKISCIHGIYGSPVYNEKIGRAIRLEHVQHVYQLLGSYIDMMCELFPKLKESLKPILEAGRVNQELFQ